MAMKLLGEKIGIPDRETVQLHLLVLLSTFLLLLLYHRDAWRPIQYWLLLNGTILFIVPLLSLVFFYRKRNRPLQIVTACLMVTVIGALFVVTSHRSLILKVRELAVAIPIGVSMVMITVIVLVAGKVDVREFGMRWGNGRFWLPITVLFFVCMIPLIYWASGMAEFQETYPMLPLARKGIWGFLAAEVSFGIFFIFWEFFFRGYLLFALEKKTGFLIANLLQAMAFAFMHLGKPELEVYSSLVGGLIIGWLCYRARSFLPAFFIHWGIQTAMDLFAVLR